MLQRHDFRRRSDVERKNIAEPGGEVELRIAIEAADLGIFDYYPLTGELHLSHRAKEHFGLSPDAHVNYNVFLVALHSEDRDRVEQLVRKALTRENGGRYGTEFRSVGIEDGKERWIAASGQAFFNARGEAVRFIGTTQDVTEHKMGDEVLKKTVRELEQANRELRRLIRVSSQTSPPAEK
jgi:PAS domain S-box-containing protein